MKKHKNTFLTLAIISTLIFCGWASVRIVKTIQFSFDCTAYLKRAADANTIELAKTELEKAIDYIEERELTEGVISIFLKNPANDLGFWYSNLKSAYEELDSLPDDTSSLEKTNVLMKLRESLTDSDANGSTSVITPSGITVYPNNMCYFIWATISTIFLSIFWILYLISLDLKFETVTETKVLVKKN